MNVAQAARLHKGQAGVLRYENSIYDKMSALKIYHVFKEGNMSGKSRNATMRAWVIPEHGGIDVLKIENRPIPEPGPGQVRIRAIRGALNHLDLWVRRGIPGMQFPLPMIPVSDIAGVVDKVGVGVDRFEPGQRVTLLPGHSCEACSVCLAGDDPLCKSYGIRGESFDGGACEYIVAPSAEVFHIPDHISWDIAAAFGLTFMTAYRMVNTRGQISSSDWVLVHAAGSGVSIAAIQFAKLAGARVIATAGSPEKSRRQKRLSWKR